MKKFILGLTIPLCLFNASAIADEYIILQKDKNFFVEKNGELKKIKKLTIKEGDLVTFKNNDNITHNLYAKGSGNEFTVNKQSPGEQHKHAFVNKGKTKIRCAIHPKMKLKVKIE